MDNDAWHFEVFILRMLLNAYGLSLDNPLVMYVEETIF